MTIFPSLRHNLSNPSQYEEYDPNVLPGPQPQPSPGCPASPHHLPAPVMPNLSVEEAARDHVYHLRHRDLPLHTHGPEDYILTPLLRNLDRAIAAMLEHFTDVSGGVDGVTYAYAVLADHASRLPGAAFHAFGGVTDALDQAAEALHFDSIPRPEAPTPVH